MPSPANLSPLFFKNFFALTTCYWWVVAHRCGFFLHSPFPSSEIFRTFPRREEVLRSMLNADLIGEGVKGLLACVCGVGWGGVGPIRVWHRSPPPSGDDQIS
jgi:hypothetical protein